MNESIENLSTPKFLLAEEPIKDNSNSLKYRVWIYAPFCFSLIECIHLDFYSNFQVNNERFGKTYQYVGFDGAKENWLLTYVQDNTNVIDSTPEDVLDEAWEWYEQYLMWEDSQTY